MLASAICGHVPFKEGQTSPSHHSFDAHNSYAYDVVA